MPANKKGPDFTVSPGPEGEPEEITQQMEEVEKAPAAPTALKKLKIYKPQVAQYNLKMMMHGEPGVGKTTMLATANLHKLTAPILIVNVEGGMLSITDVQAIGLNEPPDVIDLEDFDRLEDIFWYLAKGDHPYKSVGIDSLSELQVVNLEGIVRKLVGSSSKSGAKRDSLDDVWQDDYGTSTQQLRRLIRRFRDLPMHVFFTCHSSTTFDKDKNETVHPMLTPKLRTSVQGYLDVVSYMFMSTETDDEGAEISVRKLLCRPYGKWVAKDRSPGERLGLVIEEPSIPKIMDLLTGKTK